MHLSSTRKPELAREMLFYPDFHLVMGYAPLPLRRGAYPGHLTPFPYPGVGYLTPRTAGGGGGGGIWLVIRLEAFDQTAEW